MTDLSFSAHHIENLLNAYYTLSFKSNRKVLKFIKVKTWVLLRDSTTMEFLLFIFRKFRMFSWLIVTVYYNCPSFLFFSWKNKAMSRCRLHLTYFWLNCSSCLDFSVAYIYYAIINGTEIYCWFRNAKVNSIYISIRY